MSAYLGGSLTDVPARHPFILILAVEDHPILPIACACQLAALGRRGNALRLVSSPFVGHDFNAAYEGIPNQTVRQMVGRFLAENDPGPAR